jgi:L-ascorbate metabolism protein UlaG (beta-lactamase superfamily)
MTHKISWLGHSTFKMVTSSGLTIYVDPWIIKNPMNNLNEIPSDANVILITHDHYDHVGDTIEMAKKAKAKAKVVAQPETIERLLNLGLPEECAEKLNVGGEIKLKEFSALMVQAFHTSQTGVAAGYIMRIGDKIIYHLGDTGLFADLKLFGDLYEIDYALIPVGGRFTMDVNHAVVATEMLNTKKVIPIHYKTFPALLQNVDIFVHKMHERMPKIQVLIPTIAEELII